MIKYWNTSQKNLSIKFKCPKNQKKLFNILNDNIFSNEDCIVIIRTLLKKTKDLLNLVTQFQLNKNINATIDNAKPPIFWKDKPVYLELLKRWHKQSILEALKYLGHTEETIKKNSSLSEIPLIKQSRLSVMPIDSKSWKILNKMGNI